MQFKDAAYEILKRAGKPLHYNAITDKAIAANFLETSGKTPHASMGALLYTDTLNPDSRFRRGDQKGTFALRVAPSPGIQQQIEALNVNVRKDLRRHLLKIHPQKFEELIRLLLEQMGFEEAETTPYSNDKGVDVRGVLRSNVLSMVKVAIQAKRWTANVGAGVVRELRGSLHVADSEQGLIITPGDFTPEARSDAQAPGKTPITLINGEQLVDLLVQYQVGVKQEQYVVSSIDTEYWTEVLGVLFEEERPAETESKKASKIAFPVPIRGMHHEQTFTAELLDIKGTVRLNGREYQTPSTVAKVIVTDWKEVNGWDFWRYFDNQTRKWEKIGKLREK
jgi:restriction system protein